MFVFGGYNGFNYGSFNDLLRYNPGNGVFSKMFNVLDTLIMFMYIVIYLLCQIRFMQLVYCEAKRKWTPPKVWAEVLPHW